MYMLTMYPEIAPTLKRFSTGLWPAKSNNNYFLVIKAPKEFILTAEINKGFEFYLAPVAVGSIETLALITAFFDDEESPLVLTTPLLAEARMTHDFLQVVRTDSFDVFFLDDHNRELLSYRASGDFHTLRYRVASAVMVSAENAPEMLASAEAWFTRRDNVDDAQAIKVHLCESLQPENFSILDARQSSHRFHGAASFSRFALHREDPGHSQELGIALLFQRIYPSSRVYLNPIKTSDGEELVDVMVVGDEAVLLIQANGCPNTQINLHTSLERKRSESIKQVDRGAGQLGGAVAQIKRDPVLSLRAREGTFELDLTGQLIIGIVVVKELSHGLYPDYSAKAFEFIEKHQTPMLFFDYSQLSEAVSHCVSEDLHVSENTFLAITDQMFAIAVERGEFPRLTYEGFRPE